VILFLVGFGLFYASGIVFALTTQLGPRGWICTSLPCAASGLVYVSGIVLMLVSGFKILPHILGKTGTIQGRESETPQFGSSPEDKEILSKANELLPKLGLRRWRSVQSIEWADNQRWYWGHFSRKSFRGPTTLVLASSLRDRLGDDDWGTLLTYYFLQYKPGVRRFFELIAQSVLPFVPFALFSFLTSFVYGPVGGLLFGALVGPPVVFLLGLRLPSVSRLIFLKEDSRIAGSVGVEKLVDCFRTIDQLRLPDVEKGKKRTGWIARLWPMPSITQRISNLEQEQ